VTGIILVVRQLKVRFKTVKDAKTNNNELDGLLGRACLNHSVQEDFYLACDALAVLNERKKAYGPGGNMPPRNEPAPDFEYSTRQSF